MKVLQLCGIFLIFGLGCLADMRMHWLDPDALLPGYDLTPEEQEKLQLFNLFKEAIDSNEDGKVLLEELHEAKEHFEEEAKNGLTYELMKGILTEPPTLMFPVVFEDMWWLMTHDLKENLTDYTDVWFKHADTNGDGVWSEREVIEMIVSGSRDESSPTRETDFHRFITTLDKDGSGGLNHDELWGPVAMVINSKETKALPKNTLINLFQQFLGLPSTVFDAELMARCMDANSDGQITADEEINFVPLLDKSFSGEIEEHELTAAQEALEFCVENPEMARGEDDGVKYTYPQWKPTRITEF